MKVLCVSDTVVPELYPRVDKGWLGAVDLILSCGDLPPEYLGHLRNALDAPLYYVRGNHDLRYTGKPPEGCIDVHRRIIRFGPLRILGLEGSRWYNGGPIQYTEAQMRGMAWRLMPAIWWNRGVDIILTHAPPRYVNDAEDLCHRGFKTYRKMIDRYAPALLLHGHIHALFSNDAQRVGRQGRTRVINCYGYFRFDLDEDGNLP
ncbi:MAG: metallophosphoesterase family protein [Desulfobacterales bacterium]